MRVVSTAWYIAGSEGFLMGIKLFAVLQNSVCCPKEVRRGSFIQRTKGHLRCALGEANGTSAVKLRWLVLLIFEGA